MIDRVKIAKNTDRAADGAGEQVFDVLCPTDCQRDAAAENRASRKKDCHKIPEKTLLKGRQVAGELQEQRHTGKEESR